MPEWGAGAGVEVIEVAQDSPAARRGAAPRGPARRALDGQRVADVGDLQRIMVAEMIGTTVTITVIRQGNTLRLEVVLAGCIAA